MDFLENVNATLISINDWIGGWPTIIFVFGASLIVTFALGFVQIRYFLDSWRLVLGVEEKSDVKNADMTPFQAFLNALSASVGNGSIAGMATAIFAGGPGAAFWVFVLGIFSMALRFAEVFLGSYYEADSAAVLGGPMIYLKRVPGGKFLPTIYAFLCALMGFVIGNSMQANSMTAGLVHIFNVPAIFIAIVLFLFLAYVVFGGAQRIVKVSDAIVPLKVWLFFTSAIIVLAYHWSGIIPALGLIVSSAFTTTSFLGGTIGFTVQQAVRYGMVRSLNASEAGLGSASILFGSTGNREPVKNGIMAMLSSFISANLVCFLVMLMIISSGVWSNGLTGLNLTISAYETVFGVAGGWLVTFLSASFGLGVLVTYAYITRACWLFLTGGRFVWLFNVLFSAVAFFGAIAKIDLIWNSVDLIVTSLLFLNLYAMLWLLPIIRKGLKSYHARL